MREYNFNSKKEVIKKDGLTVGKFKEILKNLCDEDFNGNNGEDYFIPYEDEDGNKVLKSRFDIEWDTLVDEDTDICNEGYDIAETILDEAYSYDTDYYVDYTIEVIDNSTEIIIFIAYMDCI